MTNKAKKLTISGKIRLDMLTVILVVVSLLMLVPVSLIYAGAGGNENGNQGAIWTTDASCGTSQQDINHFPIGHTVYINGANFDPNTTYTWEIKGQPGGASGDPNLVVASGSMTTDNAGAICFGAYTIASDDWGEYQVKFENKGDNYQVDSGTTPSPSPIFSPSPSPSASVEPSASPSADPSPSPEESPSPSEEPLSSSSPSPSPESDNKAEISVDGPRCDSATFTASVVYSVGGVPVVGTAVTFTYQGMTLGATTDSSGRAQVTFTFFSKGTVTASAAEFTDASSEVKPADVCSSINLDPGKNGGQSENTTAGQVLGASTLAQTGTIEEDFRALAFGAGASILGLGLRLYAPQKKDKSVK